MDKLIFNIKAYLKVLILMLFGIALFESKVQSDYFILQFITYCIIKFVGIIVIMSSLNYLPFLKQPLFQFSFTYTNKKEEE